jgi:hypothetical protein
MPSKPTLFFMTPPPFFGKNNYEMLGDNINKLPTYIHELTNIYGLSDFHFMDTNHYFGGASQKGATDFTIDYLRLDDANLNGQYRD